MFSNNDYTLQKSEFIIILSRVSLGAGYLFCFSDDNGNNSKRGGRRGSNRNGNLPYFLRIAEIGLTSRKTEPKISG